MALQTRVKLAKLDAPKVHGFDHDTLIRKIGRAHV